MPLLLYRHTGLVILGIDNLNVASEHWLSAGF